MNADTALRRWLRTVRWRPSRACAAARAALEAGDLDAACARFEAARRQAPQWAEPFHGLATVARARGIRDEEERLEREALARDPQHRGALDALLALEAWRRKPVMDAWAHYHAGRWAESRAAFFEALAASGARVPEACRTEILVGIGWCHLELGAFAWAADAFYEALVVDAAHAGARKGLAIAWFRLGWYGSAEQALEQLLAARPDLGDAWSCFGWCAYSLGRHDEALARFERASAADPGLADAFWGRAWCLYRRGRISESVGAFEVAIAASVHHPSHADALDVALWVAGYEALLEPLATAIARAGLAPGVEDRMARAAAAPACAARVARARALLAGPRSDVLLDALQALVEHRPHDVEATLSGARALPHELRSKAYWLAARAHEDLGQHETARAVAGSIPARFRGRREWRELVARLDPSAPQRHDPPTSTNDA
jgi:tetratricopeptide (TPR) repeat protein